MVQKTTSSTADVSFKEKLAYGLGDAATGFSAVSVASFSMYYFTDYVGASATLLGTVLFFTRIFDAITNILMGYIVDRTKTRFGKARPWVLWTIIPMFAALLLIFSVPKGMDETTTIIWITVVINIYYLVYTMSNIPYGTLGTLVSRDSVVRSQLNLIRMIGYFSVSIALSFVTMWLVMKMGGDSNLGWLYTMIIYGGVMSVIFFGTFRFTRERVQSVSDLADGEPSRARAEGNIGFFKSIGYLFRNKYWFMIFIIMILTWILINLFGGINIYYADQILNDPNQVGWLNFAFTGAQVLGFFLVSIPIKKFGRRITIIGGLMMIIAGSLFMYIDTSSLIIIVIGSVIRGLGFAPLIGTAYAMLADVIDYGEWKTGVRNEGVTYSGGTFSTTVGSGFATAGIAWILGAAGYISEQNAVQGESVLSAIRFLYVAAPIITAIAILIMFYFYDLDKKYEQIVADLESGKYSFSE